MRITAMPAGKRPLESATIESFEVIWETICRTC